MKTEIPETQSRFLVRGGPRALGAMDGLHDLLSNVAQQTTGRADMEGPVAGARHTVLSGTADFSSIQERLAFEEKAVAATEAKIAAHPKARLKIVFAAHRAKPKAEPV